MNEGVARDQRLDGDAFVAALKGADAVQEMRVVAVDPVGGAVTYEVLPQSGLVRITADPASQLVKNAIIAMERASASR